MKLWSHIKRLDFSGFEYKDTYENKKEITFVPGQGETTWKYGFYQKKSNFGSVPFIYIYYSLSLFSGG